MAEVITERVTFDPINCAQCGFHYFVPKATIDLWRKNAATFYCPLGHSNWYGESEVDKMRRERDAAKQREETIRKQCAEAIEGKAAAIRKAQETEAMRATLDAQLKRSRKRAAAGVCPCCKRTVKQMAAHMKTKHPDYARTSAAEPK
jgi:hypothetical protein